MADIGALRPDERRTLLRLILMRRGFSPEYIDAHLTRLRLDTDVTRDLSFHQAEEEAIKGGGTLPIEQVIAHYTGPLHGHSGDEARQIAEAPPPSQATRPPAPEPGAFEVGPRFIAFTALAGLAAGVIAWGLSKGSAQRQGVRP